MADDPQTRPSLRLVPGGATAERREEDALLGAWLVGDEEAFGELVRRHEPLVLALVRRWAAGPEEARDLAQHAFLRAFTAARRALLRGPPTRGRGAAPGGGAVPFRRWLVRVAVNLGKNHLRDARRRARAAEAEARAAEARGRPPAADEALHRARQAARLRAAVLALPRRQREVVALRLDAELPFAEIAEALGTTENAAKVSFHLATRRLRELLREEAP